MRFGMKLRRSGIAGEDLKFSWSRGLLFLLIMVSCVFLAVLSMTTVYSSDDYLYSTYMDHSVSEYIQLMKEHYLTFNGRVFVHIIAHLILHFGNILFTIFVLLSFILIPVTVGKMEQVRKEDDIAVTVLLFVTAVLTLPRAVMVNGVLWISGFCNYALPTVMVVVQIRLLQRCISERGSRFRISDFLFYFYTFLCGATTEQMGIVSVLLSLYFLLRCLLQNRNRFFFFLFVCVSDICGLLTIFLSPATRTRVDTETLSDNLPILQHMEKQIASQAAVFGEYTSVLIWLGVLFLCTGYLLIRRKRRWITGLLLVLIPVFFLVILYLSEEKDRVTSYVVLLCLLLVLAVVHRSMGWSELFLVELAALASVGVMLFTGSTGHRIFLPFCLCILAASAGIFAEFLWSVRWGICVGILLMGSLLSFFVISQQLPGYLHNYEVDLRNQADALQARQTGVHYYCIDYDEKYTHIKAYNKGYFYNAYLKSAGLNPDETKIYFYSESLPSVYVGGERAVSPALAGKKGGWLLPLRSIIEGMGGRVEVQKGWAYNMEIILDGRTFHYSADGDTAVIRWEDDSGQEYSGKGEISQDYFSVCLSEHIFTEAFGLRVTHDGSRIDVARVGE